MATEQPIESCDLPAWVADMLHHLEESGEMKCLITAAMVDGEVTAFVNTRGLPVVVTLTDEGLADADPA